MFEDPDANAAAIDAITSAGAYVMGRKMFGPGRRPGHFTRRLCRVRCS
jgi:hypothetical protein